jgi:cystathionine gamma-synthase
MNFLPKHTIIDFPSHLQSSTHSMTSADDNINLNNQCKALQSSSKLRTLPFSIHGSTIECHGDDGIEVTGDISPPLHLSTTFVSGAPESYGQVYSRIHNVTRKRVEAVIGAVAGGDAVTYSSGQSAATALIHCIKPRRIYLDAGYHGITAAFKLWSERQNQWGEKIDFFTLEQCKQLYETRKNEPLTNRSVWRPANIAEERTLDLIWLESPNNPYTTLIDIEWFGKLAARTGACLVVDSTLSSPLGQRPFEHGAHVVMHSSTKYLSGHSDLLGGVLIVHSLLSDALTCNLLAERNYDGAIMGSLETWLLLRSMRTFSLRIRRQCQTALVIVQWLEKQRIDGFKVKKVYHPTLESHPSYSLAARYLRLPPATFSFELESESQAKSFARSLLLCAQATSLGGVETLIDWRYMYDTTVSPSLLRVSIGVEEPEDIIQDFEQALRQAK